MINIKQISYTLALLLIATVADAQADKTREQLGGVYYAYPAPEVSATTAGAKGGTSVPEGFEVVYISHYGRHGSRWLPSDERYVWVNKQFEDTTNLTAEGQRVRSLLQTVWQNAKGHGGQLSPLGARQHRGIADRMYGNYPDLFRDGAKVNARSSVVGRCRNSMLAFTDELRQKNPSLSISAVTDSADMKWIAYSSPEQEAFLKQHNSTTPCHAERLMAVLFKDASKVDNAVKLMSELYTIATDMQDVELNIDLYSLFTREEMEQLYDANNSRMWLCNGINTRNEYIPARSAITLWRNIEEKADEALATGSVAADLRFGHDTSLYHLLALMGIDKLQQSSDGAPDRMDEIVPMAANLQMVFMRNDKDSVLVRLYLHEQPITFPWSHDDYNIPWSKMKKWCHQRIADMEMFQHVKALNTMVGTAQANTQTAGLFGKGSEEHGQTLPAVLVPNGQNFWTPQTEDTEQKCIAPYYYRDTLFEGFRNSHWIVGGCTQDYGSFTVAVISDSLRLLPGERATRFSHDDEESHPYYYGVHLPDEHLKAELTGLSHSAVMRVTPEKDELIHVIINPNSDENQGYIEIDTINHRVYGYNPVHRIYQGWGEPAGFSGHFVLDYGCQYDLVDCGLFDDKEINTQQPTPNNSSAWLTFRAKAGKPMEFMMASSFTGKDGAIKNLRSEIGEKGFYGVEQECINSWLDRFNHIVIEDPDTARVNQFYGAFYHASFLPREMSDCDGQAPAFANTQHPSPITYHPSPNTHHPSPITQHPSPNTHHPYFDDFSMWDIYRAELPLYNIITPTLSAEFVGSLVKKYEQGGWLPIFPCWNSYTAAMIGDHASVAIADAYVKGIRGYDKAKPWMGGYDAEKAYEAMRRNAFDSPASFEDYKNGMGRRALKSYLQYNYIPMEDSVKEAFHENEQTSRTLEYAFDDFAVAQMAKALGKTDDYKVLMARSENWRNVINPKTGYADGRHADGTWENNSDMVHRKSYITEGATCHYTWYVPQNIKGLIEYMPHGRKGFLERLDSMFTEGRYWHGNEPCHQVAYLYDYAGEPWKTQRYVRNILRTEYNDTPGGLSGNDDAGQMSAWYVFSSIGFYPVCPATTEYAIGSPSFRKVTFNLENGRQFVIEAANASNDNIYIKSAILNGKKLKGCFLQHSDIMNGGKLQFDVDSLLP